MALDIDLFSILKDHLKAGCKTTSHDLETSAKYRVFFSAKQQVKITK